MIYAKFRKLMETGSVYIKDGKLIKYRWYNDGILHEDNFFHHLARQQGDVSATDLETLKDKGNVVIETDKELQLINFDNFRKEEFEKSEDFKRLSNSRIKYTVL